VPLAGELVHPWQYVVLAGAALALLALRRGVVTVLVSAALVGVAVTLLS
jgi:chromate transporter